MYIYISFGWQSVCLSWWQQPWWAFQRLCCIGGGMSWVCDLGFSYSWCYLTKPTINIISSHFFQRNKKEKSNSGLILSKIRIQPIDLWSNLFWTKHTPGLSLSHHCININDTPCKQSPLNTNIYLSFFFFFFHLFIVNK